MNPENESEEGEFGWLETIIMKTTQYFQYRQRPDRVMI
jgi:hypothetical protein